METAEKPMGENKAIKSSIFKKTVRIFLLTVFFAVFPYSSNASDALTSTSSEKSFESSGDNYTGYWKSAVENQNKPEIGKENESKQEYQFNALTDAAGGYAEDFLDAAGEQFGLEIRTGSADSLGENFYSGVMTGNLEKNSDESGPSAASDEGTAVPERPLAAGDPFSFDLEKKYSLANPSALGLISPQVENIFSDMITSGPAGSIGMDRGMVGPLIAKALEEQLKNFSSFDYTLSGDGVFVKKEDMSRMQELQYAADEKLAVVGSTISYQGRKIDGVESRIANYQQESNDLFDSLIETDNLIAERIDSLQQGMNGEKDKEKSINAKIATLSVSGNAMSDSNFLTKDTQGNVLLAGILNSKSVQADSAFFKGSVQAGEIETGGMKGKEVVAGAFSVKTPKDDADKIIGNAEILTVDKDLDNDGKDDQTKSDGRSVVIKCKAVKANSHIFVTAKTILDQPLTVTEIKAGESFQVEKKSPTNQDIDFSWWVINEE